MKLILITEAATHRWSRKFWNTREIFCWSSYSCTVFYVNSLDSYLTSEAHWEPYETSKTAKFSENSQWLLVVNCFRKTRRLRCLTEFRMHFCVWLLNLLIFLFEKLNWTLIKLELITRRSFENFYSLHEKCPYSDLFWSTFSCIRTKYTANAMQRNEVWSFYLVSRGRLIAITKNDKKNPFIQKISLLASWISLWFISLDPKNTSFIHIFLWFTEFRTHPCISWEVAIWRCNANAYILLTNCPLLSFSNRRDVCGIPRKRSWFLAVAVHQPDPVRCRSLEIFGIIYSHNLTFNHAIWWFTASWILLCLSLKLTTKRCSPKICVRL